RKRAVVTDWFISVARLLCKTRHFRRYALAARALVGPGPVRRLPSLPARRPLLTHILMMTPATPAADLRAAQFERLPGPLPELLPGSPFAAGKSAAAGVSPAELRSPADLARLPFTGKAELAEDQEDHPPYGTAVTYPLERYSRLHQTSGTSTGRPLRWLDTPESWEAVLNCWQISFPFMGLTPQDRIFFPFSFGPFIGFWSAFEAASRYGALVIPGGGMTSTARLRFLVEHEVTVVFATPTYALHLAELAAKEGIDLART